MAEDSGGIKIINNNKKAGFDYHLSEKLEVGIELMGSEVKSLRNGACQLKDSYVVFERGQMYLLKAHISEFQLASYNGHKPERKRRLLAHREEIDKMEKKVTLNGMTIVATKIYFKNGLCKVEIALAKGKKAPDKRQDAKTRDVKRELSRSLRTSR